MDNLIEKIKNSPHKGLIKGSKNSYKLDLDFSLETDYERKLFVEEKVEPLLSTSNLSPRDLETLANYMLFGKDENGKNSQTRKEIEIETKYKSYKRKEDKSLDELLENPKLNEALTFSPDPINFKKIRPSFLREEEKPQDPQLQAYLKELYNTIDYYEFIRDINKGKTKAFEDPNFQIPSSLPPNSFGLWKNLPVPRLSIHALSKISHFTINLRTQQYMIRDSYKPQMGFSKNSKIYIDLEKGDGIGWDLDEGFEVYPLGLFSNPQNLEGPQLEEKARLFLQLPSTPPSSSSLILDFTNPSHIYNILELYEEIEKEGEKSLSSSSRLIIETLNFYINLINFSPIQVLILEGKKSKLTNEQIRNSILEKYGLSHNPSYYSTIYTKKICASIASAASLHHQYFLARNNPEKFKICKTCGKAKLISTEEFVKKTRNRDGVSTQCKNCDRIERNRKSPPKRDSKPSFEISLESVGRFSPKPKSQSLKS